METHQLVERIDEEVFVRNEIRSERSVGIRPERSIPTPASLHVLVVAIELPTEIALGVLPLDERNLFVAVAIQIPNRRVGARRLRTTGPAPVDPLAEIVARPDPLECHAIVVIEAIAGLGAERQDRPDRQDPAEDFGQRRRTVHKRREGIDALHLRREQMIRRTAVEVVMPDDAAGPRYRRSAISRASGSRFFLVEATGMQNGSASPLPR